MIIDRLIEKIKETGNPTVVGLDPKLDFIPKHLLEECFEKYGETPKGVAEAFLQFNKEIIDEVSDLVPAVKPQIAMYENYGVEGLNAYVKTIEYAKSKGLIVIGDIKRSDISSTAEAYSDAHLGVVSINGKPHEMFPSDFITVNPYLGYDSIEPFEKNCKAHGKGLFILVKTSNPNSGEIQDLQVGDKKLYEVVGGLVSKWGEKLIGKNCYSSFGAVVGATHKEQAQTLRQQMPHTFFLVPGYGAQGGKAEDIAVCFDNNGLGAIVNSSRGIIAAYKNSAYADFGAENFAKASRQAVVDMRDDLRRCL